MIKGRFAPSPSGRMHLGNVYTALMSWLLAKSKGGEWVLRIEDLDRQRCKKEFADLIMEDLSWLGLEWDEKPVVFQSARTEIYLRHLEILKSRGGVYPCFCRRADLMASSAPHASDGTPVYSGTCRNLLPQEIQNKLKTQNPALRVHVPDTESRFTDAHYGEQRCNLQKDCGDFILCRADGNVSYQLAVVVDDALMGVTQVVRGNDLLPSTHQQIFLYGALGFTPPEFFHIPMLLSHDGKRLSKRDSSLSMQELRKNFSAAQLIGKIMRLTGFLEKEISLTPFQALEFFSEEKLPHKDIYAS